MFKIYRTLVKQSYAHDKRAHQLQVVKSLFRRPDELCRFVIQHTKERVNGILLQKRKEVIYVSFPQEVADTSADHFCEFYSTDSFQVTSSSDLFDVQDFLNIRSVDTVEIVEAIKK